MCNSNCYNIDANFHVFIGLALLSLLIEFCCWWWWVVGALVDALQDLLSAWANTSSIGRINLQSWNSSEPYPCFRKPVAENWQGVECLRLYDTELASCFNTSIEQAETRIIGLYFTHLSKLYQFLSTIIIEIMIRVKHRC